MENQNPVFIPGPTNIPERLRKAMSVPTWDHRSPEFGRMFVPLLADLKRVFGTRHGEVAVFTASGTGGWETAITNTLSPGDKVLAGRYGMFSQRWIDLCQRHGIEVEVIDCEWGEGAPVEGYRRALAADTDHRIKAVLAVHNETATGVRSDIRAVRAAMDAESHPAMLFVDGVSSIGSMDFRMDDWGVDVAVSGSQKGFMLATGLAIVAVSPRAVDAMDEARLPRCYFDLRDMIAAGNKGSYPYTPAIGLIEGLRESVTMLLEEGLENVHARHHRIAEGVRRAVAAWGLEPCARRPELHSDTVTAIMVPQGYDSTELVNYANETYGVAFGIGLGQVAGRLFRIGHLGIMSDVTALSGIATAEMAMKDLGYPITLGSGVAAAQEFYRHERPAAQRKSA
ncbi:aminotransferase class V-fold PLP-dependent enzyme [Aquisalimonas lutea]|uniref:L-aspartate--glyoxylate aminotransferase BhcA n=1 Tax=Aquisalimonas lutea TaxID=1327750 RepID=UPI0025B4890B|nr:L-aspartate--glyoxylate aminotransferase BhcA [Aquisalimonas lutea]MDN3518139.1 aminotransferase class V-fold PLP-dependent enzyme [Aquisalimonas lutea]